MDSSNPKGPRTANFYSGRDVRRDQVLLAVIILLATTTMGEPITCDFPSVAPMEEGRLTCYFPEDVHRAQKDIVVYRHVLDGSPAEAVLGCWWRNAHLDCSTRQGYVFDDVISDHLTIRVPHATADKTGTYACQVTGYRADDAKICEFILNSDVPDHSSYKGLPIQNNYPILHVVDGTIIGLLVFLLLLIALAMCYLRHRVRIKEVWGRFTKVFKDKELDPLVKHENEEEGSKREPEVPEVVVVSGRRGHAMCGWEGPALSRPDSIVETIETEQDESENYESCANQTEPRLEKKSRDTSREEKETDEGGNQSEYHLEAGESSVDRSVPLMEDNETGNDQCDSGVDESENGSDTFLEKNVCDVDMKQNEPCEDRPVGDTSQGSEDQEEHEEHESLQEQREVSKDSPLQEDRGMNKDQADPPQEESEMRENQSEPLLEGNKIEKDRSGSLQEGGEINRGWSGSLEEEGEINRGWSGSLDEGGEINRGWSGSLDEGGEINRNRSDSLQEELEKDEDRSEEKETDEDSDVCLLDKDDTDDDQCDYELEQNEADDAGDVRVCLQAVAMGSNECLCDTCITSANSAS